MAVARFYHLTHDPVEGLLPVLIGKAFEGGLRVALRGVVRDRMEALDQLLWAGDGFLPHGLAGGAHDSEQPALLCWEPVPAPDLPNRPQCLITLDAAPVDPAEAGALERLCVVFDGMDEGAVQSARAQWRQLTEAGVCAEYWSRASGKWRCEARHPKT